MANWLTNANRITSHFSIEETVNRSATTRSNTPMDRTPLQDLMAALARAAVNEFNRHSEIGRPQWLIEDDDGNRTIVAIGMTWDKDMVATIISHLLKDLHAARYAAMMEVWSAVGDNSDVLNGPPPSQRLDRGEAVIVTGEDINGEKMAWFYPIDRSGDKPCLKPRQQEQMITGRFVDLFPPKGKPQ